MIMKSTFSRMAAVALTMWLGFATGSANAVPVAMSSTGWDFSVPGVATNAYDSGGVATSSYSGFMNFSLPSGSTGAGEAITAAVKAFGGGVIDTFELWVTDNLWSYQSTVATTVTGLNTNSATMDFAGQTVPGYYSLRLVGHNANRYSGSIATPVPEPEMFAMMLAGLGLLGFSARRRNNNT